jgi:GH24 family phage-related lysozyme (muramidase)
MASKKTLAHLKDREGVKYESYLDSRKKPTAGVGHLLSAEEQKIYPIGTKIPEAQVNKWLEEDLAKAETAAKTQADQMRAKGLAVDPNFEESLISVNFQLGTGWTKKFPSAWENLQSGDYKGAISQIQFADPNKKPGVKSSWADQTPVRVNDFTQAIQAQADYKNAPGMPTLKPQEEVVQQGIPTLKPQEEVVEQRPTGLRQLEQQMFNPFGGNTAYGFKKGGPVKNKYDYEAPVDVSVEDVYKNYRMQEAARRSMMQGNDQDRMDDYAYAREQARRPFVNRYPVDSRGQGAYSTAAPMRNQAARMMGFASGGSINTQGQRPMMTNPQTQANGLASLGRGGDSTLVHMQPQEVAGLQQLAQANGTSLTTNPDTGMPEAFKLGNFFRAALPIAAGFFAPPTLLGLGATGSAIAAGAATGGTLAAMSGEDILAGTLSGGLGGMSGGGLQGAFGGVGEAMGAANAGAPTLNAMGQQAASQAAYGGSLGGMQAMNPAAVGTGMNVGAGASGAGTSMFTPAANTSMNPFSSDPIYPSGEGGTSAMGRGYDQIASNLGTPASGGEVTQVDRFGTPTNFTPKVAATSAGPLQMAKTLGTPLASMGMAGLEESDFIDDVDFNDPRDKYDPYSKLNLNKDTGISEAMRADTGLRLFGGGGTVGPSSSSPGRIGGAMGSALGNMQVTNNSTGAAMDTAGMTPEEIFRRYFRDAGAPTSGYAQGGYLNTGGKVGDGMSDSIPATINGDQPAALSDGEFVIPADVVSHLGNGSSSAGAQRLKDMMSRLRKARTGNEEQGKQIAPKKYMPA